MSGRQMREDSLVGLALPAAAPGRSVPPRCAITSDRFWERYDTRTLFYAALHDVDAGRISLFAPLTLNLRDSVLNARYMADGVPLPRPRHRRFGKYDRFDLQCQGNPDTLQVEIAGAVLDLPLRRIDRQFFAGSNLLYTLSRDNDPVWVRDWLIWNQRVHGANAVLIADNDSTTYSRQDLLDIVASVPGYSRAMVIGVPFSYGPANDTVSHVSDAEFLQLGVMNALWMQYMAPARAVLNIDIDELVYARNGGSVFDAAARSFWGIVMARGAWRYARPGPEGVHHADHVLARDADKPCAPKYCLRPESIAGRRSLKVHGVSGFKRMPFVDWTSYGFYHCRNISTSWKYDRNAIDPAALVVDPQTETRLSQGLA